jgi:ABC-type antimicrobial peptide transport system permease subunit
LPLYGIQTMDEVMQAEVGNDRVMSGILTIFAGVALLLSAVGIYGIIAYAVSQRTREIGLRIALGARGGDVIRMVMRHAAGMTALGLTAGLAIALAASRYLGSFLFEVSANDPATFAGVAGTMVVVSLLASYIPARRAARVDPVVALRAD